MKRAPSIFFILLLLLIEFYSFTAINTATKDLSKTWRIVIIITYITISILVWVSLGVNRQAIHQTSLFHKIAAVFVMSFLIAKVIITLFLFLGDTYRAFSWLKHSLFEKNTTPDTHFNNSRSKFLSQSALLVGGAVMSIFFYGIRNKYRYAIKRVKIKSPKIPAALKGLKIVQISDIHSGSFDDEAAVAKGIQHIQDLKPDLILFTGDMVNNIHEELVPYKRLFSTLKAPLGTFAVLGNHDYGDYVQWETPELKKANLDTLKQHFADMNWRLLMNEHLKIEHNGAAFTLLGIENWGAKARFPKYGRMEDAVRGIAPNDETFKILLSHDPSHWDAQILTEYPEIDLTLSGHTHGMQFGLRLPWMKWSPVQYVYSRWAGLYKEGHQQLYVNPGFGFLGYKGRVGILPEITLLELS